MDSSSCPMFGSIAKTTMQKRQENVLMSDMITMIENKLGKDDPFTKIAKTIIMQAYARPLFSTESVKQQEINDFANKTMSICYSTYK